MISFLNTEPAFLEEAIASVIAQEYQEWELLLVDDGSTNASREVAERHVRLHPARLRLLEHEGRQNRGLSESRNLGIRESTGEMVTFLDADDVWLSNKLGDQVRLLDSHADACMVYGNTEFWYSWTGVPDDARKDHSPRLGVRPDTVFRPPYLLPRFLRGTAAVPCMGSLLLRRTTLTAIGGFEASFRGMYEDQVFYAKVALECPILVSASCWDRYRQHANSMTSVSRRRGEDLRARRVFMEWLTGYLSARGITDAAVWRAVRHELWAIDHPALGRAIRRASRLLARLRKP